MKKHQRIIGWLNIFLLLINVTAFATILYLNNNSSESPNDKYISDHFLKEELKLTEDQYENLSMLDEKIFRSYQILLDLKCEATFGLIDEMSKDNPSKQAVDSILTKIGRLESSIKRQTANHFTNIKSIVTEDQQILLDKLFQNMLEMNNQCSLCNKKKCARRNKLVN
jgi:hypothetical protein